jgi:ACS family glucarate transporter-like MFS transporter
MPFIRDEFSLNYTQAGWLNSAFLLAYGVSQLPGGWLSDRISPRILVTLGISGVSLAGLMAGLSPNYMLLATSLIMLGLLGGGYHPSSAPLISASIEPGKRGRALGLHQIGGTASYFLAPLIAVGIASSLGWRSSFILISIPIIILGIVLYVVLGRWGFTRQSVSNRKSIVRKDIPEETPGHKRRLISFITLSVVGKDLLVGVISFIPLYIVDHFGIDDVKAGGLLFIVYLGGLWAGPLGGYLSDRLGKIRVMVVGSLIAGPIIYLLNLASFGWSLYVVMTLVGMSMYLLMPTSEAYIISHTPEHRRSTILGIYYFGSRGGPGVVAPVLGYLIDKLGFDHTFTIAGAIILIVTLICSIFLRGSRD